MKIKTLLLFLIAAILSSAVSGQSSPIKISTQEELKSDISQVPCKDKERLEGVKNLFKKMGAADEDIKVEDFKDVKNLLITKKGKSDETIIIGAHYDKVADGRGAIDNWTGIVVIANLYRTIKDLGTEKTYIFAAFGKEEIGLVGSTAMAKAIPKEKRTNHCSMVNVDSFGLNYPQILENASSSRMAEYAEKLAKEFKMPFQRVTIRGADSDSTSFNQKNIPAISFSGLSNDWQRLLHSTNDKVEKVNIASVYVGYQFVLQFIAKLDTESCGIFRKQKS